MIKIVTPTLNLLLAASILLFTSTVAQASNQASEFVLPSLDGSNKSRSEFGGSVMLLHFWATWCKPCVKEMPEIEASYQALKDQGFVVVTINTGDSRQKANAFIKKHGFDVPVLLDKNWEVAGQYGVRGLPTSFFIDSTHNIYKKVEGGSLTQNNIMNTVRDRLDIKE